MVLCEEMVFLSFSGLWLFCSFDGDGDGIFYYGFWVIVFVGFWI